MITVDAMGKACPMPVVMAKKAITELQGAGDVLVKVDNEIAVSNLTKMASSCGYKVKSEMISQGEYNVIISVGEGKAENIADYDETACETKKKSTVVVISSDRMGEGSDELGRNLMKGFVFALTQQDVLPDRILFYNGGVKLCVSGSEAIEDLKNLEKDGVIIEACGTCLNFYELADKLEVGSVTNMYAIVESLLKADNVIRP